MIDKNESRRGEKYVPYISVIEITYDPKKSFLFQRQ